MTRTREPFNDHHATSATGSIGYRVQGNGPNLLLLAGGDGDIDRQQALASLLSRDHRVITHDRRGLSASHKLGGRSTSMATHLDDLRSVLDHAGIHGGVSAFGTSTGAHLALLASSAGLVTDALVVHEAYLPALVDP